MRPSKDEYFLLIALATSARATCIRRAVGAVAIDENDYILSTGYNGLPKGINHCIDEPCLGANSKTGNDLHLCGAIHAEQNLIAHCANPQQIHTIYLTVTPCISCMKLIIATGCRRIVASEKYDDIEAIKLFEYVGGEIKILSIDF